MDPIDFTLQLLSMIFTAFATIIAIGSIDTRWSLAAIVYRRLRRQEAIDWNAERARWQEAYRIDVERVPHHDELYQRQAGRIPSDAPLRTWSGSSDSTVVVEITTRPMSKDEVNDDAKDYVHYIIRPQQAVRNALSRDERKNSASNARILEPSYQPRQRPTRKLHHAHLATRATRVQQTMRPRTEKTKMQPVPRAKESMKISERCSETL
ncbi:hypothetical protein E8E11_011200 [Didymella keratinophila]|nr:hypothetical protein E8E11_011200 [Didymella keratinophila]